MFRSNLSDTDLAGLRSSGRVCLHGCPGIVIHVAASSHLEDEDCPVCWIHSTESDPVRQCCLSFCLLQQTISLPVVTWTNGSKLLSGALAKRFICVLLSLCCVFPALYVSRLLVTMYGLKRTSL